MQAMFRIQKVNVLQSKIYNCTVCLGQPLQRTVTLLYARERCAINDKYTVFLLVLLCA